MSNLLGGILSLLIGTTLLIVLVLSRKKSNQDDIYEVGHNKGLYLFVIIFYVLGVIAIFR